MVSQIARDRIAHVVVLMLENRSFDHLFGFISHPNLTPLSPGSHPNRLIPADASSPGYGVSDDAGYALPVDPPHSHLGVMKQFRGRPPKMDGFVAAYAEKAVGKELLPIIHWWLIEALILVFIAALTAISQWLDPTWAGAVWIGVVLAVLGTSAVLPLRNVLDRWWRIEGLVAAVAFLLALLSRPLGSSWPVAAATVAGLAVVATAALLWLRSRPLYRHPPDLATALESARLIMRCMPGERIPVLGRLAREFAVCTRWHCSVPGETWPNRNFAIAATSDDAVGIEFGLYESPTVFELLADAGRTWRIYHRGMAQAMVFRKLWEAGEGNWFDVSRFAAHVAAGDLATYSFIEPNHMGPNSNSQHPGNNFEPHEGVYDFERGEALIASIYESLRSNPEVFAKTLFLITYDEHGGLFDHVPPPTNAVAPTLGKAAISLTRRFVSLFVTYRGTRFDFRTLGARVPTVVVSPWVAKGRVDDTLYDHTSIVATLRGLFAPQSAPLTRRDRRANTFDHLIEELSEPRGLDDLPRVQPPGGAPGVEAAGAVPAGPFPSAPEPDVAAQFGRLAAVVEVELDRIEPQEEAPQRAEAAAIALEAEPDEPHARVVGRFRARSERRRSGPPPA